MFELRKHIKGDIYLWLIIILLTIASIFPVLSVQGTASKHLMVIFSGLALMFIIHRLNFRVIGIFSGLFTFFAILVLIYTAMQARTIDGANASRWLSMGGLSVQPSAFAIVIGIVFTAYMVSKSNGKNMEKYERRVKYGFFLLSISAIVLAIFPSNLSTALIFFVNAMLVLFVGGFSSKYIVAYLMILGVSASLFIALVMWKPDLFPNRVKTWKSRIESFANQDDSSSNNWQSDHAKTAIALGGIHGQGPGKSVQKNILPQANSDFVYSIILEEYGLMGGLVVLMLFCLLLFRINVIVTKVESRFGKLLVLGLGFTILTQAFINMGVSSGLLPVTGQTLPLLSSGGTAALATYISLGIILSVSKEINLTTKENPFPIADEIDR